MQPAVLGAPARVDHAGGDLGRAERALHDVGESVDAADVLSTRRSLLEGPPLTRGGAARAFLVHPKLVSMSARTRFLITGMSC